ncbi:hypothetical protein TPA0907_02450 [Micromonospora humidisoli]|nr:hypothetical protein TPA0907_02450 [Micromonospora sp. AKA109]
MAGGRQADDGEPVTFREVPLLTLSEGFRPTHLPYGTDGPGRARSGHPATPCRDRRSGAT